MAKRQRLLQRDKTEKVYSSPRQEDTYLYFTGTGDDISGNRVGEGSSLYLINTDGNKNVVKEAQFLEDIYLKDGYLFWQNAAIGDRVSMEVYLPANVVMVHDEEKGNADADGEYVTDSETPDETWIGTHIKFPFDYTLIRFVNKFNLIGDNTHGLCIESTDAALIAKELKMKVIVYSPTENAKLVVSVMMEMYRERTI